MTPLNLPAYEYNVKNIAGKVHVFDALRKKFLLLTPEEWVRQHFIHYMIHHLHYPKSLIRIETGLKYNTLGKRSDIILYARTGEPWMVVECKSAEQKINQQVVRQASVYNVTLKAKYVALTNGLTHLCWGVNAKEGEINLLKTFPLFDKETL